MLLLYLLCAMCLNEDKPSYLKKKTLNIKKWNTQSCEISMRKAMELTETERRKLFIY